MNRLLLVLLIGWFACCNCQSSSELGLQALTIEFFPFCETSNQTVSSRQTVPTEQLPVQEICANPEDPLKCKTLLDNTNNKEWVAVVHGKGILFFQINNDTAKPIANYPSQCPELFVIGVVGSDIVISSSSGSQCTALGLGTIALSDLNSLASSSSSGSGSNATNEIANITVTPHTNLFSFMDFPLWSPETSTLIVYGASNASTSSSQGSSKMDLILKLDNGVDNPTILFQASKFPFYLDRSHSILFALPSSNSTSGNTTSGGSNLFLIGAVMSNISSVDSGDDDAPNALSNGIAIWDVSFVNSTQPQRVSTFPLKGARFVAISSIGDALYVSVTQTLSTGSNVTSGSGNTTGSGTNSTSSGNSNDDMFAILNSQDPRSLSLSSNLTYSGMRTLAQQQGLQNLPQENDPSTNIKRITAMEVANNQLMIGWNTGELFIFDISSDALNPTLMGYINVLRLDNFPTSTPTTADLEFNIEYRGVSDICPWRKNLNQVWVTAYDHNKDGSLFVGLKETTTA